ncbi:MAG TPA: hypothetical protein DC049_04125 [Spirochaetia bacterium]|nr:hypothetical protein [Spirochaetia bacterium]
MLNNAISAVIEETNFLPEKAGHYYTNKNLAWGKTVCRDFLFWFLEAGDGYFQINGFKYPLYNNSLVFIKAGDKISFTHTGKTALSVYSMHFLPTAEHQILFQQINGGVFVLNDFTLYKMFKKIFSEEQKHSKAIILSRKIFLFSVFKYLLEQQLISAAAFPLKSSYAIFLKLKNYIDKNFLKKISLFALAQLAHIDKTSVINYFKIYAKTTPVSYMIALRLREAARFLKKGYSVKEAAYYSGFSDPYFFSKTFKKYFNLPPVKYKSDTSGFLL